MLYGCSGTQPFKTKPNKIYFSHCCNQNTGCKVQVTFHRSREEVTAPTINYQTTHVPLDLREYFVMKLGLGDTFICIMMVTHTLTLRKVTCILDPPHYDLKWNLM